MFRQVVWRLIMWRRECADVFVCRTAARLEVPLRLSRRTIAFRRAGPFWNWRKKRLHLIASIANALLLSSFCNASAAGLYDGQWNGSATAAQHSRCKTANVAITVLGQEVVGEAKFGADSRNINGTVRPDGTFGGTIGFQHLVGKFNEDKFEGAFRSFDCAWTVILKRGRAPTTGRAFPSLQSTFVASQILPLQSIRTALDVSSKMA